ncbi:MAG: M16 family metallopeptidase, partial [Geothrix sp.]
VLLEPAIEAGRLELGRKQLLAELERSEEDAARTAETRMEGLLFGNDRPRPTPASLDQIERADLVAFHGRILHPANLVVSASGGFDRRWLQGVLERRLGSFRPGPTAVKSPTLPAPRFQRQPCISLVHRSVSQSVVRLALSGPRRSDPDWEAATVMNEILGGRLSAKLRVEHGLTYGIRSSLEEGDLLGRGDWLCTFRTKNQSVATALRLVLAEIEKLKNAPVAETELGAVKDGIIQAFPAFWSNRQNRVETFGNDLLRGWGEDRALAHRARITAISAANVQSSARAYLDPSKLVVLIVGNIGEVEAGDPKEAPGSLKDMLPLPIHRQPDPVAR